MRMVRSKSESDVSRLRENAGESSDQTKRPQGTEGEPAVDDSTNSAPLSPPGDSGKPSAAAATTVPAAVVSDSADSTAADPAAATAPTTTTAAAPMDSANRKKKRPSAADEVEGSSTTADSTAADSDDEDSAAASTVSADQRGQSSAAATTTTTTAAVAPTDSANRKKRRSSAADEVEGSSTTADSTAADSDDEDSAAAAASTVPADQQGQPSGQGANGAPAVRAQGIAQVWNVLVKGYRDRHQARQRQDDEKVPGARTAGNIAFFGGLGASGLGIAASGLGLHNGQEAEERKKAGKTGASEEMEERSMQANWIRTAAGVTSLISTGAGLYSSIWGIRKAAKNKQRNKKRKAIFDTVAGSLGAVGGLASTTSGIMGLKNADATATGVVGAVGTLFTGLGSLTRTIGAGYNTYHHGKVASKAGEINEASKQTDPNVLSTHATSKINGDHDNKDSARAAAKARLYAMEQAKNYNKAKAIQEGVNAATEGILGVGSAIMGLFGGINSLISKPTPGAMKLGGSLGIAAAASKFIGTLAGKATKKVAESKSKNRMHEVVDGYIQKKKSSIVQEAGDKLDNNNPGDPRKLTQQEHDLVTNSDKIQEKIAIARLGIDLTLDTSSISEDIYKKAFKEITFRRAENILNSGNEKDRLLGALRLPTTASVEEVAEALGYEG